MKALISYFLLLFPISSAYGANPVFHYEPETMQLIGTIEQQTFPGPPTYESIPEGDEVEKGWYLDFFILLML